MGFIDGAKFRGKAKFSYDFATQGGASGNITLLGDPLPKNAVLWDGCVDVITALTSAGDGDGTAALSTSQSANDIVSAASVAGAPWSTTGLKATVPTGAYNTAIKMTAQRAPILVVAGHDLTAGKFNLLIEYFLSD